MRLTVTGATGLIGRKLVRALTVRDDDVTVLSRDPGRAGEALGVPAVAWDPLAGPAPAAALTGRDAVLHLAGEPVPAAAGARGGGEGVLPLAGEPVARRWTAAAKKAIHDSRQTGTRNLVAGLRAAGADAPRTLVSSSAVGYYGKHGDEEVPES